VVKNIFKIKYNRISKIYNTWTLNIYTLFLQYLFVHMANNDHTIVITIYNTKSNFPILRLYIHQWFHLASFWYSGKIYYTNRANPFSLFLPLSKIINAGFFGKLGYITILINHIFHERGWFGTRVYGAKTRL